MAVNKIGDTSPTDPNKESSNPVEHRKVEKVEKIQGVSETENERRRRSFQRFMESDDETSTQEKAPSPYESSFFKAAPPLEDLQNNIVPDASSTPPPHVNQTTSRQKTSRPESSLPHSHQFWSKAEPTTSHQKTPIKKDAPEKKEKKLPQATQAFPSVYAPPGKTILSVEEEKKKQTEIREKKKGVLGLVQEEKGGLIPDVKSLEKEHREREKNTKTLSLEEKIDPSQFHTLAPPAFSAAQTAITNATPHLNHEISPLFFQMVGSIYTIIEKPGIFTTEIVLNAKAFVNSPFFGMKIAIEKYATAPNSLNIRLIGNQQSVKVFEKNIPSLYTAFQNGNFNFQIGRISTEYAIERPLFRRKESGEGKRESGGDEMKDPRGDR